MKVRSSVAAAILALAGCTAPLDLEIPLDDFVLPEPDLSLDPARVQVGDLLISHCTLDFSEHVSRHEWVTVDVYLWPRPVDVNIEEPSAPTVGDPEVRMLESAGVRVLRQFQTNAVRGRILYSSFDDLLAATSGRSTVVRTVPDATRYDVPVIVGFSQPLDDSRLAAFSSLGGMVERELGALAMVSGGLPDRSVAALRERYDVSFVEVNSVACLLGGPAGPAP